MTDQAASDDQSQELRIQQYPITDLFQMLDGYTPEPVNGRPQRPVIYGMWEKLANMKHSDGSSVNVIAPANPKAPGGVEMDGLCKSCGRIGKIHRVCRMCRHRHPEDERGYWDEASKRFIYKPDFPARVLEKARSNIPSSWTYIPEYTYDSTIPIL
jgi:hypothetical protein